MAVVFTCPICRRSSANPNDAANRYCGFCHRFVDDSVLPLLIAALQSLDWQQVVQNGGPPCFQFESEQRRFCLRAERWPGHGPDHPFVSLADLVVRIVLMS